ncbi:F0F1 ATP synthase subunit B [Bacillus fonticola]|uniref:F0F1 ATP synthase subunit B n=1 Tax=Bacillus fonticola TaxID=2728853 RepID=UPI001884A14B|nr:F0F1 ATP synthase subunit B [Bacillus fonticola]
MGTLDMFVLGAVGFNWGDSLYQLIAFIILLALLRKFAWGPITNMMKEREKHVASQLDDADAKRDEANKLLEEHRALMKEARQEAQELIERARKQGEDQRESILVTAREEASRLKESAKREIDQQKDQAVAALREQVASLSVMIASKVIEKNLSEEDQHKIISSYLDEAGDAK